MKISKSVNSIKIVLVALVLTAIVGVTTTFAATYYHDYGFAKGKVYINYWKDSSVASFGYTSYSNTGINNWKNITGNLNITEVKSAPTYFGIVTYVGNSIPGLDVYGVVDHFKYGLTGFKQVNPDDQRDRSRVRMDHTNLKSMKNNAEKQYAFTHEFGHAVGLKHNNSGVASVMSETIISTRNTPQTADKDNIKSKYRN